MEVFDLEMWVPEEGRNDEMGYIFWYSFSLESAATSHMKSTDGAIVNDQIATFDVG